MGGRKKWTFFAIVVLALWLTVMLLMIYSYPMPVAAMTRFSAKSIDSVKWQPNLDARCDSEGGVHLAIASYDGLLYFGPDGGRQIVSSGQFMRCSMALDSEGIVHIAAMQVRDSYSQMYLLYFRYSSGKWESETVRTDVWDRGEISIAIDARNEPCVSYTVNHTLNLASRESSNWSHEVVAPYSSGSTTILDGQAIFHVFTTETLMDYVKRNGTWVPEYILGTYEHTNWISAAIDPAGAVHLAFPHLGITHAVKTAGAWNTTIVDRIDRPRECSIDIDSSGREFVAYSDSSSGRANLACNSGSGWTSQTLTEHWDPEALEYDRVFAYEPTVTVDSHGVVHVFYWERAASDSMARVKVMDEGGLPVLYTVILKSLSLPAAIVLLALLTVAAKDRHERQLDKRYGPM